MKSSKYAAYVPIFLFALSFAGTAYAENLPPKEPIVVDGDNIEYLQNQKKVIGTGNISITYKDVVLTCDKVAVNLETHDAEAEGNVKVTQKGAYFLGDKIDYNFDTREAFVTRGYIDTEPFYGRAKSLFKEAGKDEFELKKGSVTTCDLDKPHYRIQTERVKIYLGDKVVANNVKFMVGNVPIMYLPYYVQPLSGIPKNNVTIMPGNSEYWGNYVLTAMRYYFSDKSRGDLLLDYRAKLGLAYGVNHYLDSDAGKGAFKFYYTKERYSRGKDNDLAFERTEAGELDEHRYRYQYRHKWDIKEADTTAIMEFDYLSDPFVIKDYFYNEYEEFGDHPDSYLSLITAKSGYTTEFLLRKRFNKFYTAVERLPEYRITIPSYKFGDTSFYYSGNSSAVYLNLNSANGTQLKDVNTIRLDTYNQLSYPAKLFKSLSVTPYAGIGNTYYSRNKWGTTNEIRTFFREGVDSSIKFYKLYDINTNLLGLDINKLRHVVTPTANYYHIHQPTISPDNLTIYDGIDSIDTANSVALSLENKLQTKRKFGDEMKSVDLLRLMVTTDYPFRLRKERLKRKTRNIFNDVDFKLDFIPYPWLYVVSDWSITTREKYIVDTAHITFVAGDENKWSLSAGQTFSDLRSTGGSRINQVTMDGKYKINDKWSIHAYERFDLSVRSAQGNLKCYQQEITLSRDLHCWTADLTYGVSGSNNHTLWLILRCKAFPDIPIGLNQTYSRPRPGATLASTPRLTY